MGTGYLIDTNIVRKYLDGELSPKGLELVDSILDSSGSQISFITRIELLGFSPNNNHLLKFIDQFLQLSSEYGLSEMIIQKTIDIRKQYKIKIPDAIIAATALCNNLVVLSDNDSDFGKVTYLKYINPRKY